MTDPTRDEVAKLLEKATPGPWIYYADLPSVNPDWHIVTTANKMRVLANVHIEPGIAMDDANAALIAIAPFLARQYVSGAAGAEAFKRAVVKAGNELPDVDFTEEWTEYEHGVYAYQRAIQDLPSPSPADLLTDALALPEVRALGDALEKLHYAVCGEAGFAEAVRSDAGFNYPWPALDEADALATAALAALKGGAE